MTAFSVSSSRNTHPNSTECKFDTLPVEVLEKMAILTKTKENYLTLRLVSTVFSKVIALEFCSGTHAAEKLFNCIKNKTTVQTFLRRFLRLAPDDVQNVFWALFDKIELHSVAEVLGESLETVTTIAFGIKTLSDDASDRFSGLSNVLRKIRKLENLYIYTLCKSALPQFFFDSLQDKCITTLHMPSAILKYRDFKTLITAQRTLQKASLSVTYEPLLADKLQGRINSLKGFSFQTTFPAALSDNSFSHLLKPTVTEPAKLVTISVSSKPSSTLPDVNFFTSLPKLVTLCQMGVVGPALQSQKERQITSSYEMSLKNASVTLSKRQEDIDEITALCGALDALYITPRHTLFDEIFTIQVNQHSQLDTLILYPMVSGTKNPFQELDPIICATNPSELILLDIVRSIRCLRSIYLTLGIDQNSSEIVLHATQIATNYNLGSYSLGKLFRLKRLVLGQRIFNLFETKLDSFTGKCFVEDSRGNVHPCNYLDIEKFKNHHSRF
jgi:hypothetical protein